MPLVLDDLWGHVFRSAHKRVGFLTAHHLLGKTKVHLHRDRHVDGQEAIKKSSSLAFAYWQPGPTIMHVDFLTRLFVFKHCTYTVFTDKYSPV